MQLMTRLGVSCSCDNFLVELLASFCDRIQYLNQIDLILLSVILNPQVIRTLRCQEDFVFGIVSYAGANPQLVSSFAVSTGATIVVRGVFLASN